MVPAGHPQERATLIIEATYHFHPYSSPERLRGHAALNDRAPPPNNGINGRTGTLVSDELPAAPLPHEGTTLSTGCVARRAQQHNAATRTP
ncbi:hypothetical protein KRMM14A1004_59020 [Krasilnikovia sp. MM14-A1004]